MGCENLDEYLAGRLSNEKSRAFEAHAQTCAVCGSRVARHAAIQRAQQVLQRNDAVRTQVFKVSAAKVPTKEEIPSQRNAAVPTGFNKAQTVEVLFDSNEPKLVRSNTRKRNMLIAGVVVLVGALAVFALRHESTSPRDEEKPAVTAPAPAAVEEPKSPEPEAAPEAPPTPDLEPVVAQPAPPTPPAPTPTAPTPPAPSPAPTPAAPAADANALPEPGPGGFYAIGTDIEVLAQVVASKRCGQAVAALKQRVVVERTEVRTWQLLTQCYAKRHKWREAVDAFDKVHQYGNVAQVAAVQAEGDRARAALEAEANAAAAAAATPTAPEPLPQ